MTARNLLLRIAFNGRKHRPAGWPYSPYRLDWWIGDRLRIVF